MVILAVIIVLLILLLASAWSSARSYFAKGRLAGMEEATLEIIRGINSHYEEAGQAPPDHDQGGRRGKIIRPRRILRQKHSALSALGIRAFRQSSGIDPELV